MKHVYFIIGALAGIQLIVGSIYLQIKYMDDTEMRILTDHWAWFVASILIMIIFGWLFTDRDQREKNSQGR